MTNCKFYLAGHTAALQYAASILKCRGYEFLSRPDQSVTHLLLPVPSFDPDGTIKGGGSLAELLSKLPKDIIIFGGNLDRPELTPYQTVDLLKDPEYVARNAAITAHCAIKLALNKLPITFQNYPVLVVGWGRIGKCLADLLKKLGAQVTVAARKASDRAVLLAMGYRAVDTAELDTTPYRVIFNTVPVMVSPHCPGDALKIDLASKLGLGSLDVIWARGLPNQDAPESSGELIACAVTRILTEKGVIT